MIDIQDITAIVITIAVCETIGYCTYIIVTHADGLILGGFLASVSGLLSGLGVHIHHKRKYKVK